MIHTVEFIRSNSVSVADLVRRTTGMMLGNKTGGGGDAQQTPQNQQAGRKTQRTASQQTPSNLSIPDPNDILDDGSNLAETLEETTGQTASTNAPSSPDPAQASDGSATNASGRTATRFTWEETGFDAATITQGKLYEQAVIKARNVTFRDIKLGGIPMYTSNPERMTFGQSIKELSGINQRSGMPTQPTRSAKFIGYGNAYMKPTAYNRKNDGDGKLLSPEVAIKRALKDWHLQAVILPLPDGLPSPDKDAKKPMRLPLADFTLVTDRKDYPPYLYFNPGRSDKPSFTIRPNAPQYMAKFDKSLAGGSDGSLDGSLESSPPPPPVTTPREKRPPKRGNTTQVVIPDTTPSPITIKPNVADLVPTEAIPSVDDVGVDDLPEDPPSSPPGNTTQTQSRPRPVTPPPAVSPIKPVATENLDDTDDLAEDLDSLQASKRSQASMMLRDAMLEKVLEAVSNKSGIDEDDILEIISDNTSDRYLKDLMECIIARLNGASPKAIRNKLVRACRGFFHLT